MREIELLPNLLLVLLVRDKEQVVPTGETVIQSGDEVVLSALASGSEAKGCLIERTVGKDSTWRDKPLSEIRPGENKLVVLIQRGGQLILPDGNTVIREGDVLVLSRS